MLLPILTALAGGLYFAPVIGRAIASRISARQKLYARENHVKLKAAADSWRLAMYEEKSAGGQSCCNGAENARVGELDQSEGIVELGRPGLIR